MTKSDNEQPRTLRIRRAAAYDVVNLAKMLINARDEQAQHIFYPSIAEGERGRMMACNHLMDIMNRGVVYVADLNGRLLGVIGMHVDKLADWSDDYGLMNEWFYVLPQFRDSDIARALLEAVETWADADIQPWTGEEKPRLPVVMGILSGHQTGLKNKLMQQLGYANGGGNFVRAPQYEQDEKDYSDEGNTRVA